MKNENIKKINTMGKVCRILLIFPQIILIVGFVCCIISAVFCAAIPKTDVITIEGSASAQIRINGDQIPAAFLEDLLDLDEGDFDFDLDTAHNGIWVMNKNNDSAHNGIKWEMEKNNDEKDVVYDLNGEFNVDNTRSLIWGIVKTFITAACLCALIYVALIFGRKLAKALEVCNSPFEESVIKSMKKFAFSLIPLALLQTYTNGAVSLTTIVVVIAMIIFSYIFSYGAELQRESDETL